MVISEQTDLFSLEAIKELAPVLLPIKATWDGFQFKKSLDSGLLQLDENKSESLSSLKPGVFQLNLENIPLPCLSTPPSIPTSDSENDYFQSLDGDSDQDELVDVWVLSDISKRRPQSQLHSWDNFLDKGNQEPASGYISEAEPGLFNGILESNEQSTLRHVKPDILLHAFFELCVGRGSVLFRWEEKDNIFAPQWLNIAAYGYSSTLVQNCFDKFSIIGMKIRDLTSSFRPLDKSSAHLSPSRIAFLSASRCILHAVHKYLSVTRPSIMSLLQLRSKTARIGIIVDVLKQCHDALEANHTQHSIICGLVREAAKSSLDHPGLSEVLQLTISRTCRPILTLLSEQIGLSSAQPDNFRDRSAETRLFDKVVLENLLGSRFTDVIREAQRSLDLLRGHSPDCSLLTTTTLRTSPLKALDLGCTFQAICERQSRAVAYEEAMMSLIVSAESSTSTSGLDTPASECFELGEPVAVRMATAGPFRLERDLFNATTHVLEESTQDELQDQVVMYLGGQGYEESTSPLDLEESLNLSLTPLISAQHRLLSYSVLRLLFQDHNLLGHLHLQQNCHLLGNALFSSRLSIALFDSDQNSGEGQRTTGASTGLRLQARDTWPPAGSELRLVLMNILSDSLRPGDHRLQDYMCFAIRDMPAESLEKCRDVGSIHALDFLRLQYTAPNEILGAVITPDILDKYDRIFQHLLRTLRLHAVTQNLLLSGLARGQDKSSRLSDHKAVLEMHHFITTIAEHYHNTAIALHWRKFEAMMRTAKARIDSQDYDQTLLAVKSLDHLCALHEATLDSILHALLLKRRQALLRQILEDVYGIVLRYNAQRRSSLENEVESTTNNRSNDAVVNLNTTKRLHEEFRSKVMQFMDALRSQGQTAKQVSEADHLQESDSDDKDINLFEHLLLRLNVSGYWAAQKGRDHSARNVTYQSFMT